MVVCLPYYSEVERMVGVRRPARRLPAARNTARNTAFSRMLSRVHSRCPPVRAASVLLVSLLTSETDVAEHASQFAGGHGMPAMRSRTALVVDMRAVALCASRSRRGVRPRAPRPARACACARRSIGRRSPEGWRSFAVPDLARRIPAPARTTMGRLHLVGRPGWPEAFVCHRCAA